MLLKTNFKKFYFCYIKNSFFFNGKFYIQIDGVAIGSLLVPALTKIFMGYQATKWLKECNLNKPKLYLIYFDGILAACDKEKD